MLSTKNLFFLYLSSWYCGFHCWILRETCFRHAKFDKKYDGKFYNGKSVHAINDISIKDCAMHCVGNIYNPFGFNYWFNSSTCQLLMVSLEEDNVFTKLQNNVNAIFVTTSIKKSFYGIKCEKNGNYLCGQNEMCFDRCSDKGYECIKNIAMNGETSQSSVQSNSVAAIDGVYNLQPDSGGPTTHTGYDVDPWFQINLKKKAKIYKVRIINKNNSYKSRLHPFSLYVANATNAFKTCEKNLNGNLIEIIVTCNYVIPVAQYIKIQTFKVEVMHIQEMEIYGIFL